MATEAQIAANRANAKASTGPRTTEGKQQASSNALKFGLFSTKNCVQPEEIEEYEALSSALWTELSPTGAVEEMIATEIVRGAWRLRRCAVVESELAIEIMENAFACDPMLDEKTARIQAAVDRARAQAQSAMRRSMADLKALQTERWLRYEVLPSSFDESGLGLAETSEVMAGKTAFARLTGRGPASGRKTDPARMSLKSRHPFHRNTVNPDPAMPANAAAAA